MTATFFADGIGRVTLKDGTVRIEFATVEGQTVSPQTTVVLTTKGFVEAFGTLQKTMTKLIDQGTVTTGAAPEKTRTRSRIPRVPGTAN